MDQVDSDQSVSGVGNPTGRRSALGSLGMLGMALLAALGSPDGSSAKTKRGRKKRGPAGPPGPQGPTGPTPAVSVVRGSVMTFSVSAGGFAEEISNCPGTSRAISRRITIGNPHCGIVDDAISVDGGAWSLALKCPAGESSSNLVEVICLA
jgi:hypothetical protein